MTEISLEFLAQQNERIIAGINAIRDDINVLTAMVLRQDNTLRGLVDEVRAMHKQHNRFGERLRKLETP
jgi:hypothetical protein